MKKLTSLIAAFTIAAASFLAAPVSASESSLEKVKAMSSTAKPNWEALHPGAGGQVQGIYCDPNTPGRLFFMSDMEGIYRSDDFGITWRFVSENVLHGMTFTAEVEPGNSDRVYLGTLYGLSISDNGGINWKNVDYFRGSAIATITVDAKNPNNVYVGPSWIIKDSNLSSFQSIVPQSTTGERVIHISKDRGKTWKKVKFEDVDGYRQVYTIDVDPNNSSLVYIGTDAGVYKSLDGGESWTKISGPEGTTGQNRGMDITPDGKYVYATFMKNKAVATERDQAAAYVADIETFTWKQINTGLIYSGIRPDVFWNPKIDPRSTSTEHKVIMGSMSGNTNLFEGTFTVSNNEVSGSWMQVFGSPGTSAQDGVNKWSFDWGWNRGNPLNRVYTYTPITWPERRVWTMNQQSLFVGDTDTPYTSWEPRHSEKIATINGIDTYKSRGIECTYNNDMVVSGSYMAQSMADNGILESFDYGRSWTEETRPGRVSNGDALEVINTETPIILAGVAFGYGGATGTSGELWAKRLIKYDNTDRWKLIAGGAKVNNVNRAGLPQGRVYSIVSDPQEAKRVYIGGSYGIYAIDDIESLVDNGTGSFYDISGGSGYKNIRYMGFDPKDANTLYVAAGDSVWKGAKGEGIWQWSKIYDKAISDMAVWGYKDITYIAVTIGDSVEVSTDGGSSWNRVFTKEDAEKLKQHIWYDGTLYNGNTMPLSTNSIIGINNKIYFTVYADNFKKGYAAVNGRIQADGSILWSDMTGEYGADHGYMPYPRARRAKIYETDGKTYLYYATMGTGLWRTEIDLTTEVLERVSISLENTVLTQGESTMLRVEAQYNSGSAVDLSNAAITYFSSNPDLVEIIEGEVIVKKPGSVDIWVTVNVAGIEVKSNVISLKVTPDIEYIPNIYVRIKNKETYTLPKTVLATMSDGTKEQVEVNWVLEGTEKHRIYIYKGTVEGYEKTVLLTIMLQGDVKDFRIIS